MPTRASAPVGHPCWVDLMTADQEGSRAFYGELFGWTSEDPNEEFGGYLKFLKDGRLIAGCMRNDPTQGMPDGMPDVWSVYLAVADAEATVKAAEAAGGGVFAPAMAITDLGSMAVVTDPGGAVIGMWQPGTHKGFTELAEPSTPGWFELLTRDYDASVDFYRTVFGWNTHVQCDTPEFRYTTLEDGPEMAAGIMDATAFLPEGVPNHWSVYFTVDDTALRRQLQAGRPERPDARHELTASELRARFAADAVLQVAGEPAGVAGLELGTAPVVAGDRAPAARRAARARHRFGPDGAVEEGVVGGELLTGGDVAHGGEDDVAGEAGVGLARVVDEQHHRLVLLVSEGDEVEALGDLDLGVLELLGQGEHRRGVDDVATLHRHHLTGGDGLDGEEAPAGDAARVALAGLGRDPRCDDGHRPIVASPGPQPGSARATRAWASTLPTSLRGRASIGSNRTGTL